MSSIIRCGPSPSKLAFWVDWKMADIISPLPGCSMRKSGKSISVEEQQIILNVAKYFQEESKSGNKPQFTAGAVIAKTVAATGVSKNFVRKIVSAGKVIDEGKTRKAKVRFGKLDNFDVGVIRRTIHNLYRENISPSLKKILLQLKEKMNFPYGKTHLWRLLKKMGFGYEKRGRQRIISERPEIIAWRERYLRRIRKIREADPERVIVYTDETWLDQGHRTRKEWVDLETLKEKNLRSLRLSGLTVGCTKEMTGKGRRLIITDTMAESGPVRGALWMFKADGKGKKRKIESKSKELSGEKKRRKLDSESTEKKEDTVDGGENDSEIAESIPFEEDYHDSMDGESYKCYFEKSICQNIPKHYSVIVIDNAPYHSKNTEHYPTSKWRKQQFVDWLTEKNITFPDKALRAELWTLVKSEREKFPDKVMETVAKEYGHEILRLAPYHCELNPIELAWAAEENYVAGENKDMSLDSVEKLFRKKREELPKDFWRKCVEHVKKIEENYWESDRIQDNKDEQLIIKLKPTDSSSSEMESFSESSDSSDSDQP